MHGGNSTCEMWLNEHGKCHVVAVLIKSSAALSVFGCLFVFFVMWLFEKYKHFVQRLLLNLSISAALCSLSYALGDMFTEDGGLCTTQYLLMQFFGIAVLLWEYCIAAHLVMVLRFKMRTQKFEPYFHIIVWGVSGVFTLPALIMGQQGPAGIWCWIKPSESALRFGVWYIPVYAATILLVFVFAYIMTVVFRQSRQWHDAHSHSHTHQDWQEQMRKEVRPLVFYPLIYIVCQIPVFAYRIYDAAHKEETSRPFALLLVVAVMTPLIGATTAILFALDRETRRALTWTQIKDHFFRKLCWRRAVVTITHGKFGDEIPAVRLEEDPSANGYEREESSSSS